LGWRIYPPSFLFTDLSLAETWPYRASAGRRICGRHLLFHRPTLMQAMIVAKYDQVEIPRDEEVAKQAHGPQA
jgi:hypothetical protein